MTPLIEVTDLERTYQRGDEPVPALRGVSCTIDHGEFVVLAGPSGSGKSTLLHLLGALDRPDAGDVRFEQASLRDAGESSRTELRRHQIGFVFQAFNLVPVLSAFENVEYGLWLAGMPQAERRSRVERALKAVGLGHRMTHRPDHLSGGERQRVAIARALVHEPKVILADEPTASLDSHTGIAIVRLLHDLNVSEGTTIIVSTHDPAIAALAPRVLRLADGRIVADERRPA